MPKQKLSRLEVARILQDFLEGTSYKWAWDDFISLPLEDTELERIRIRCATLDSEFPPVEKRHFCGEEGFVVIGCYVKELLAGEPTRWGDARRT
jgi:hypothetical protein